MPARGRGGGSCRVGITRRRATSSGATEQGSLRCRRVVAQVPSTIEQPVRVPQNSKMKTPRPISAASFSLHLKLAAGAALLLLTTTAPAQQPAVTAPADPFYDRPEYYVVQKGDTLPRIADRFELDYRDLAAWNKIPESKRVAAGKRLRLYPPGRGPERSDDTPAASAQITPARDAPAAA